jgi:hypothetical protein
MEDLPESNFLQGRPPGTEEEKRLTIDFFLVLFFQVLTQQSVMR